MNHQWSAFEQSFRKPLPESELERVHVIVAKVPGYSTDLHYRFFKACLLSFDIKSVLMLGVYAGRDICFLQDIAKAHGKSLSIIGVDKFSDTPCEDWSDGQKAAGTWENAGFGGHPTLNEALWNTHDLDEERPLMDSVGPTWIDCEKVRLEWGTRSVCLLKMDDELFFSSIPNWKKFDFAYLDTSHDYSTVQRQLRQVGRVPCFIIAGDDYKDMLPTWGVSRAVQDGTTDHRVFDETVWITTKEKLRG